ncbi:cAMP-dependent protein kinase catalytic subunit 1-like [Thrips palmi]|uniref:cAMP-dependent protein kinase catalytic subunit 1-like n=1 Tax=Thrips palmi TaxID=161013 RepID=A0A6P8ZGR7_THRPL|nr:cAMP-dependent protein kinase catalytic subunit 1-like [Thrips palmi]
MQDFPAVVARPCLAMPGHATMTDRNRLREIESSASYRSPPILFRDLDAYFEFLATCKREFDASWRRKCPVGRLEDWDRVRTLGSGSFGRVILVQNRDTKQFCVMKVMEKAKVIKMRQKNHVHDERRALNYVNFPFIVSLVTSFKNFNYVFLVMPFVPGGEMFSYLRRVGKFGEDQARFYAAQVVLSFEYLHNVDLIYRDLKPENILLDDRGYVKLADLGFCKVVKGRTWTLCGTPEYLAPELILSKGYGKSADWWSFGVLLYEMAAGFAPFHGSETMRTYEKIVAGRFRTIPHFSPELKDLVERLLQADLSRRLGILRDGVNDVKRHAWFRSTNWLALLNKQVRAPYVPRCQSPGDSSNYDVYVERELTTASQDRFPNDFIDF